MSTLKSSLVGLLEWRGVTQTAASLNVHQSWMSTHEIITGALCVDGRQLHRGVSTLSEILYCSYSPTKEHFKSLCSFVVSNNLLEGTFQCTLDSHGSSSWSVIVAKAA